VAVVVPALASSLGSVADAAGVTAQARVTINAAKDHQLIAGFGESEGFGQAKRLMNSPASVQKQVLSLLYSPTRGGGLTILRNEISADAGFTIGPRAPRWTGDGAP
jgi:O-glycosyl hydrolase